jgi:alpha-galactosidase
VFTAQYPMQPRNPGSIRSAAKQHQAWIAGPDASGNKLVVLAN